MKCIGLLGGMSWESSLVYYRIINQEVKRRLGPKHSARCVLYSVDFEPVERMQHDGAWDQIAELLCDCAGKLALCGAEVLVLCTNTMHAVADRIQASSGLDFLHIVDATARRIRRRKITRIGLLGTRFTMEGDFYLGRLREKHGIEALVPEEERRAGIHRIIYDELCQGIMSGSSRKYFLDAIEELAEQGAQGIVLGCTEIPMLVKQESSRLPLFDTTALHARAAVERALG
jgi:aspartate racemase